MTNPIKSKKVLIPAIIGLGFLAVILTVGPISAIAEPTKTKMPDITGSVNVEQTMKDYIAEHRTISFSEAASTAEKQVTNGVILSGQSGIVQGYLVYTFFVLDSQNETGYKVIIDAGNNQVLYKSDGISLKDMGKFAHGFKGFGPFGGHGFGGHFDGRMMPSQGWTEEPNAENPAPTEQQ
jgi:hypothetical protein